MDSKSFKIKAREAAYIGDALSILASRLGSMPDRFELFRAHYGNEAAGIPEIPDQLYARVWKGNLSYLVPIFENGSQVGIQHG